MVTGKRKLDGKITISGAKNAVLPQMAASLLTREKVVLRNVPDITDVNDMILTLEEYGVTVSWDKPNSTLELQADWPKSRLPDTNVGENIRAAFLVFGPLLARTGRAEVYKPGGCKIGKRPVDFHIKAMQDMEAKLIKDERDKVFMKAEDGLKPGSVTFVKPSVGATETALMAASLVNGDTVIRNAAIEPEIYDLAEMLEKMGAEIDIKQNVLITEEITDFGIEEEIERWNVITVKGCESLSGVHHQVMPDRIEFGTYAIAAAMNNAAIVFEVEKDKKNEMLDSIYQPLQEAGVKIAERKCRRSEYVGIEISLKDGTIKPVDIKTGPYPDFPTDLLPLWVAFMTQATPSSWKQHSTVHEQIFESRFNYVEGLKAMGAKIRRVNDREYRVYGGAELNGTRVDATDLRGGAALVLAGLVARGTTVVRKFENVQRGYENMVEKLNKCGAKLEMLKTPRRGHHGGPGPF